MAFRASKCYNATRARPRSIHCTAALLPQQRSPASTAASQRGAMLGMGTSHTTAPSGHPLTPGIALGVSPQPFYGIASPAPGSALCMEQRCSQRCSKLRYRIAGFVHLERLEGDKKVTKHRGHNPGRATADPSLHTGWQTGWHRSIKPCAGVLLLGWHMYKGDISTHMGHPRVQKVGTATAESGRGVHVGRGLRAGRV